jgi:hypothetical protein
MNAKNVSLLLSALLAFALSACLKDESHVVGSTGGSGGSSGSGGASGSGGQPVSGSGGASQALSISPEEAVSRLVQVLWNTAADPAFVAQHAPGILTRADVSALAAQMLQDPKASPPVGAFYRWWLDLNQIPLRTKDAALFPQWNATLAADMARETETFGVNVTLAMNGSFSTLMTAPFSFVNERLAPIYGLGGSFGPDLQFSPLNPAQRGGILTQPGLQAQSSRPTENSPTHRGKNVVERMFCLSIPEPPASVPPLGDDGSGSAGRTLRQRLEEHESNPSCAACHRVMDPLGFAFEGFDPIGRARATDNGLPVDLTGILTTDGSGRPFNGPMELGALLATSKQAQECMVKQWMTFMLGRSLQDRDAPSLAEAQAMFAGSAFRLRTIISAVAGTEAFLAP